MTKSDELREVLEAGDEQRVVGFFRGMPEKERRALAPHCLKHHAKIGRNRLVQTAENTWEGNPLAPAADLAALCTGTYAELTKIPGWSLPTDDVALEILVDRRPDWLEKWALYLLDGRWFVGSWALVRTLVRQGLIARPDHPNYTIGMIGGLRHWSDRERKIVDCLRDDPELIDVELWRLFEHEGGGEQSLANFDRFGGRDWSDAFLALIAEGRIPRARVLKSCLGALRRDMNHYRAKWFMRIYDALSPSADERAAEAETFPLLMTMSAPNVVSWAYEHFASLVAEGTYEPAAVVAHSSPVVRAPAKGLVKKALKVIAKTAKAAPEVGDDAARAAVDALAHEAADVQKAALDVIDKAGRTDDGALVAALAPYRKLVAASLRARLEAWTGASASVSVSAAAPRPARSAPLGDVPEPLRTLFAIDALAAPPVDGAYVLPCATFDGTELPQLAARDPIVPIATLDELIETAARVLEDAVGPDDVERVLDGLSRLCAERPDDFEVRTAPLLKRANQRMKRDVSPFTGEGPVSDLCGLVHAWVCSDVAQIRKGKKRGEFPMVEVEIGGTTHGNYAANTEKAIGLLSRRSYALSKRVAAQRPMPLFSAPTHSGALIDPRVLVERVRAYADKAPDVTDVVLAMLRLAPEGRSEALAEIEGRAEWIRALRHALGAKSQKAGPSMALWVSASRARAPWSVDDAVAAAFGDAGGDAGEPATYALKITRRKSGHLDVEVPCKNTKKKPDLDALPLVMHRERGDSMWELGGIGGRTENAIRWTASMWPTARESFFAAALVQLSNNLDWWEADWYNKALLEPLLQPGTPLRDMGLMLLAVGLAAKEPGEHGLATDAAIAAIEDGRLGSDNFGRALAELLASGLIKPGRWATTLADVARASPAHAAVVKLALEPCLFALADPPRDFGKLLELLQEISVELGHGVAAPHREHLEIKGSSKTAKAARALRDLPTDGARTPMARAAAQLHDLRVAAALRWARSG